MPRCVRKTWDPWKGIRRHHRYLHLLDQRIPCCCLSDLFPSAGSRRCTSRCTDMTKAVLKYAFVFLSFYFYPSLCTSYIRRGESTYLFFGVHPFSRSFCSSARSERATTKKIIGSGNNALIASAKKKRRASLMNLVNPN